MEKLLLRSERVGVLFLALGPVLSNTLSFHYHLLLIHIHVFGNNIPFVIKNFLYLLFANFVKYIYNFIYIFIGKMSINKRLHINIV